MMQAANSQDRKSAPPALGISAERLHLNYDVDKTSKGTVVQEISRSRYHGLSVTGVYAAMVTGWRANNQRNAAHCGCK